MSYTDKMIMRIIEEILPEMPDNVTFSKPESRFFNDLMREVKLYVPQELHMPLERCFFVVIAGIERNKLSQNTSKLFIYNIEGKIKDYKMGLDDNQKR